ncbi:MAG: hypothetical protein ACLUSP_01205 [Christensenellales bacterium]
MRRKDLSRALRRIGGRQEKGRSSCEKTIYFDSVENVYGKFLDVKVTATKNNRLKGEVM